MAANLDTIRGRVGPGVQIGLVCKADAYGHGLVPVGRFASRNGADWLCVASVQEGVALRDTGVDCPIMVMSPTLPVEARQAVFYGLDVFAESEEAIRCFADAAVQQGRIARIHLKVDTGLHRFGCRILDAPSLVQVIQNCEGAEWAGIAQHFVNSADDQGLTLAQLAVFDQLLDELNPPTGVVIHASNSVGASDFPSARKSLVRIGMNAYGIDPSNRYGGALTPVMRWYARVTSIREVAQGETVSYNGTWQALRPSRIATLGVGYGDGYARALSNRGEVFIRGSRAPVAGLVCMDQMMADVTDVPDVQIGDSAELFGPNVKIPELAAAAGTNSHEIATRLMTRVNRRYVY